MTQNNSKFANLQKKYNEAVRLKNPHAIHALQLQMNALQNKSQAQAYRWTNWFKPSGGKTRRRRTRCRHTRRR